MADAPTPAAAESRPAVWLFAAWIVAAVPIILYQARNEWFFLVS